MCIYVAPNEGQLNAATQGHGGGGHGSGGHHAGGGHGGGGHHGGGGLEVVVMEEGPRSKMKLHVLCVIEIIYYILMK